MTWHFNETVRSGNSTARVKNFYPDTGFIVLMDIRGSIGPGSTIVGDDSGETLTLTTFNVALEYDLYYDPNPWEDVLENAIYIDSGELITLDGHEQDSQTTYYVVQG